MILYKLHHDGVEILDYYIVRADLSYRVRGEFAKFYTYYYCDIKLIY